MGWGCGWDGMEPEAKTARGGQAWARALTAVASMVVIVVVVVIPVVPVVVHAIVVRVVVDHVLVAAMRARITLCLLLLCGWPAAILAAEADAAILFALPAPTVR